MHPFVESSIDSEARFTFEQEEGKIADGLLKKHFSRPFRFFVLQMLLHSMVKLIQYLTLLLICHMISHYLL